ncbi:MAG: hypothetical protein EOO77_32780 [Oxalobacteraceae bacterium]|nr:MAG: hypothetical protein EOO77_32780 [Oxalobacteraceae bacterium]
MLLAHEIAFIGQQADNLHCLLALDAQLVERGHDFRFAGPLQRGGQAQNHLVGVFIDELLESRVPRELRIALPHGLSADQRTNLDRAASAIDEITCSTIHGFCQRLIKPYPVEANIDPGASLMDPAQADLVFGDTVDRWLRDTLNSGEESLVSELVFLNPTKASELVATAAGHIAVDCRLPPSRRRL